jgi:hypothetical protein
MDESRMDYIPQLLVEENALLTTGYSEDEVKKPVFQIEHNKAVGPNGFPVEFYQIFEDTIKADLLALFSCLHARHLELFFINFGEIILLPKINEAEIIQQYNPSALLMLASKFSQKWPPKELTR